ncbi:MAG: ABC transporter ATP-binding protein [Oscillospiraceae bacterium]|nr:ABC transporter ATP-binding protein [Oscillospiraceae bacterium]
MIEFRAVTKRFGSFAALNALDLCVPQGAVYGLIGPNGAGKTTAIRCLTGMLRPEEGEILLSEEPVYENEPVKERFFCIPDEPFYFPMASTKDMMRFYSKLYPRFDAGHYEKLKDAFALDEDRPIRRLSRGMQKQSAFWLALAARPEVLILDEPVDGLDPVMRRQVWSLILSDVAENEMTVLVSSHNLRELEDVCDHVGIVERGRCLRESSVAELQENIVKVVLALPEGGALPEGLDVMNHTVVGKLHTLIIRGRESEVQSRLETASPLFLDTQPLTLEEIFIYEMGGADYAVKELLL